MDLLWHLAASTPGTVVLDSWWFKPRDLSFAAAGLERCGAPATVEVWCDVPAHLARDRYAARLRHQVHQDQAHLADSWRRWAEEAQPLNLGPALWVRTDEPVDVETLAREVARTFEATHPRQ